MTALIELEIIHEGEADPQIDQFDLDERNHCFALVVGFGNQIYEEMRATAHTAEVAVRFVSLLRSGGFEACDNGATNTESRLGRPGDICLNAPSPYVWLSQTTTTGERFHLPPPSKDAPPPHAKPHEAALPQPVESPRQSPSSAADEAQKKSWWKFWQ